MKPDIVFFGEGLPDIFHQTLEQDKLSVSSACVSLHTLYTYIKVMPNWITAVIFYIDK